MLDAVIVGAGPNGLAAAVTLARAGLKVQVLEANNEPGGAARTLPDEHGVLHDWGAAVHPMAFASPFFRQFELAERVDFVVPDASYAHPVEGRTAAIAWRDLSRTAQSLGPDGKAWTRLLSPLVDRIDDVVKFAMTPMAPVPTPISIAIRYGLRALEQGSPLSSLRFREPNAPALLAGALAHSVGRIPSLGTSATGLMLATTAHSEGWPIPVGGTGAIIDAMVRDFELHGGHIVAGNIVKSLADIPSARVIMFDTSARQLVSIAGDRLHARYRNAARRFQHGNAVAKVDFTLSAPVPWANSDISSAGTVHVAGTKAEVSFAESEVAAGRHPDAPFVLASQPTLFDTSRAPDGHHVLWTYAHVPAMSSRDMTESVTRQIERFAPGFRDTILRSHSRPAADIETGNLNLVGGDIATGAINMRQLIARPVFSRNPWAAGTDLYLCSAATTPGPGVHGMGGFQAATKVLQRHFGMPAPSLAREV